MTEDDIKADLKAIEERVKAEFLNREKTLGDYGQRHIHWQAGQDCLRLLSALRQSQKRVADLEDFIRQTNMKLSKKIGPLKGAEIRTVIVDDALSEESDDNT